MSWRDEPITKGELYDALKATVEEAEKRRKRFVDVSNRHVFIQIADVCMRHVATSIEFMADRIKPKPIITNKED